MNTVRVAILTLTVLGAPYDARTSALPRDDRSRASRSANDSLVLWDSAQVTEPSRVGHVSWTASCFGEAAARTCGDASSLIFDDAIAATQGADTLSVVRVATLRLPFTLRVPGDRVRLRHQLRLHVEKSARARVALVVETGGATTLIDYPRGARVSGDRLRTIERAFPAGSCRTRDDASCRRAEQVVLLLVATRDRPEDVASLTVDSDDVQLHRTSRH